MYDACVPWPERPKGAKDKSRGPKGLELEVGARRAPKTTSISLSVVLVQTSGETLSRNIPRLHFDQWTIFVIRYTDFQQNHLDPEQLQICIKHIYKCEKGISDQSIFSIETCFFQKGWLGIWPELGSKIKFQKGHLSIYTTFRYLTDNIQLTYLDIGQMYPL